MITAGVSVKVFQVYRPQLWIGWAFFLAGMGAFIAIRADSPLHFVVGVPILSGVGAGILFGERLIFFLVNEFIWLTEP